MGNRTSLSPIPEEDESDRSSYFSADGYTPMSFFQECIRNGFSPGITTSRYPDKVAILVDRHESFPFALKKHKYLISGEATVEFFRDYLCKANQFPRGELYLYLPGASLRQLPPASQLKDLGPLINDGLYLVVM